MRLARAGRLDPQCVALIAFGEQRDRLGHCRREQQGAAFGRGHVEDFLEILAEPQVEHLVGLVEDHRAQRSWLEGAAFEMVLEPARRAHHDVAAMVERALFDPDVHPADAARDPRAEFRVEPLQFALDLERELAGRGDDQCERFARAGQRLGAAEQRLGDREAIGDRLARSGLRRNQQVAVMRLGGDHLRLDGGRLSVAAFGDSLGDRPGQGRKGHRISDKKGRRLSARGDVAPFYRD